MFLQLRSLAVLSLILGTDHLLNRCPAVEDKVRLMTYNLEWFSEEERPERIANLKRVLSEIKPDIVCLNEIQSLKAAQQLFGDDWEIGIADDPEDVQETAIAVRKPLKLVKHRMIFTGDQFEDAFPGRRDLLEATVQLPGGSSITGYVVHLKSRSGGRWLTDARREAATGLMASYIRAKGDKNVFVAGDFNDSPNDRCANILETGDLMAPVGTVLPRLFVNMTEPLYTADHVTHGLERHLVGETVSSVIAGATAENEKWRGKEHKFPDDLKITATFLDQIMVTPNLAAKAGKAEIFAKYFALSGKGPRVKVEGEGEPKKVTWLQKGDQASDHCPVFVDLAID